MSADPFLEVVPIDHQPAGATGLELSSAGMQKEGRPREDALLVCL